MRVASRTVILAYKGSDLARLRSPSLHVSRARTPELAENSGVPSANRLNAARCERSADMPVETTRMTHEQGRAVPRSSSHKPPAEGLGALSPQRTARKAVVLRNGAYAQRSSHGDRRPALSREVSRANPAGTWISPTAGRRPHPLCKRPSPCCPEWRPARCTTRSSPDRRPPTRERYRCPTEAEPRGARDPCRRQRVPRASASRSLTTAVPPGAGSVAASILGCLGGLPSATCF
jgi:hypothetical protein